MSRWLAMHGRGTLWSAFLCSGSGATLHTPVDALLGLMRHPLAVPSCLKPPGQGLPSEEDAVNVEDKGERQLL